MRFISERSSIFHPFFLPVFVACADYCHVLTGLQCLSFVVHGLFFSEMWLLNENEIK